MLATFGTHNWFTWRERERETLHTVLIYTYLSTLTLSISISEHHKNMLQFFSVTYCYLCDKESSYLFVNDSPITIISQAAIPLNLRIKTTYPMCLFYTLSPPSLSS